jgi:hypothetical protein
MKAANTNSKESDRRKAILSNKYIRAFLIIGVVIAFISSIPYLIDWYYQKWVVCCHCAEADAATINQAIAVYYTVPEHMDFPELETLIEEQSLRFCDGPGQHTWFKRRGRS